MFRLPDQVLDCIGFLCVDAPTPDGPRKRYGGTAFFVQVRCSHPPNIWFVYLVTAKHNVERAKEEGRPLFVRVSRKGGGVEFIEIRAEWTFAEDPCVDVAVLPVRSLNIDLNVFGIAGFDAGSLMNDKRVAEYDLGIGDEVFIPGLFPYRHGEARNLPILRTGHVACMPNEPILDERTACLYYAYLLEVRSLGGLSGSPVFMMRQVVNEETAKYPVPAYRVGLMGIVRGHFDLKKRDPVPAFFDDTESVNMGLALATPSQAINDVLGCRKFRDERLLR